LRYEIWVNYRLANYPTDEIEFEELLNDIVTLLRENTLPGVVEEHLGIYINLN